MLLFFSDLGVYFYHRVEFIALYFGKYALKYFCFWSHKSSFNLFLKFLNPFSMSKQPLPCKQRKKQERVEISNRCLSSNFILLLLFSSPFYCLLIYLAFLFSLWKPAVSMAQRATTLLPGSAPELEHFFWAMQALEKGKGQPWYLLVQHWTNVTRLLTLVMPETELSVSEEIKLRSRIIFELFSLAI